MVQTLTGQQRIARCLPTAGSPGCPGLPQELPKAWRPGRARCTHPRKSHLYAAIPGLLPSRPREPSLPGQCERSDHRESTDTRQLIEVKPYRARLVLRWVTTLESRVALSFLFATFAIFFAPLACFCVSSQFCDKLVALREPSRAQSVIFAAPPSLQRSHVRTPRGQPLAGETTHRRAASVQVA